jgi:hypothetical protein
MPYAEVSIMSGYCRSVLNVEVESMLRTLHAVVRAGKVELLEGAEIPDGTRALVTLLPDEETDFWLRAGETALANVWGNPEDDVYGELLEK